VSVVTTAVLGGLVAVGMRSANAISKDDSLIDIVGVIVGIGILIVGSVELLSRCGIRPLLFYVNRRRIGRGRTATPTAAAMKNLKEWKPPKTV
jgi:hypothetical protein